MPRAMITLDAFQEKITEYRVHEVKALATSAMRDATNGPKLAEEIKQRFGFEVEIIDGDARRNSSILACVAYGLGPKKA